MCLTRLGFLVYSFSRAKASARFMALPAKKSANLQSRLTTANILRDLPRLATVEMRMRWTWLAALAWIALAALPAPAQDKQKPRRPNVLFLIADDHAAYVLGCYGNKQVKTPNLDKLASQ